MPGLDLKRLGNLVLSARKRCGLTQKELAKQTGLSVKTIQDTEKGRKRPSYETLARLIERLGIPPENLFQTKETISTAEVQPLLEAFNSFDAKKQGKAPLLPLRNICAPCILTPPASPPETCAGCGSFTAPMRIHRRYWLMP